MALPSLCSSVTAPFANIVRFNDIEKTANSMEILSQILQQNATTGKGGIYAVCSSHPLVLEAAIDQAFADGGALLIEATANQVNQFGGYTGMLPADFRDYVYAIAARRGLDKDRIILGGDHLGPVCWTGDDAELAMAKAAELVRLFAGAGFQKIHLDCSMPLLGDPEILDDAIVARRAAQLCDVAEAAAIAAFGTSEILYVIGTEVPPPGGAHESLDALQPTSAAAVKQTVAIHKGAFHAAGLAEVWPRVSAVVVQPGVEFDNAHIFDYRPELAAHLPPLVAGGALGMVYEAHSTDYQTRRALAALVRSHFAILKVGPGVTFALREALFALSHIEDELIAAQARSNLRDVMEREMLAAPKSWEKFYHGGEEEQRRLRRYSLSDRIRYYWPNPAVEAAVATLFANLADAPIPHGLLSQYLPDIAPLIREGQLPAEPVAIVKQKIRLVLADYSAACRI